VHTGSHSHSSSNDQIEVAAPLTYGGTLIVSNLGPTALAVADNFKLFSAGPFAGSVNGGLVRH